MPISISEQRQIENEMIFRRLNEKVGTDLDTLDAMHLEDRNPQLQWDDAVLLNFKCECSDEDCNQKIPIELSVYREIHTNRNAFIVKLKHQVEGIEKVILTENDYCVVEKNNSTAEPNDTLKDTTISNA